MEYFSWIAQEASLTNEALTVRVQALAPNNTDRLIHDIFFPRTNVNSTTLQHITTVDFRPASDRREWNTRGRLIPIQFPKLGAIEMIPIESYFTIAEQEIQKLLERTLGNEALFRQIVGSELPDRVDGLAFSNLRRMEFDAMQAWALGTITVMNPQLGGVQTVSYGFDATRYTTAATAWDNGAVNAYNLFLAWVQAGIDRLGGASGAVMRRATYNAIQADSPMGVNAIPLTRQQFEAQFRNDLGRDFTFYVVEHQLDKAVDGGTTFTRTNVWPATRVALVPDGTVIGDMAYAPVGRAFSLARTTAAEIDVRGQSVFREVQNNGRQLNVECQVNSFPIPNEQRIWVINAGV